MVATAKDVLQNSFDDFWWRFDKYELRDGCVAPASGAKIERYYPWRELQESKGRPLKRLPRQRAYHSLLDLVAEFDGPKLGADEERAVLDWCGAHGLLGLLTCRTEMATLAGGDGRSQGYHRRTGGWQVTVSRPSAPGVLIRPGLHISGAEFLPLKDGWGGFFPGVPQAKKADYNYPVPCSDRFWREYAEPLGAFVEAARMFSAAVEGFRKSEHAVHLMQSLTAPVQTIPYVKGHRGSVGWASYSLLSAFAMMATFDLAGMRIGRCANPTCTASFAASSRRARYCSATCRKTVQVRRNRRRRNAEAKKEN